MLCHPVLRVYLVDQLSYSNYGTEKKFVLQQRQFLLTYTKKLNILHRVLSLFRNKRERTMSEIDIPEQCNIDTPLTIVDREGEHGSGLEPIVLHQVFALTPARHVIQRQNLENSNTNIKLFIFFETRGF